MKPIDSALRDRLLPAIQRKAFSTFTFLDAVRDVTFCPECLDPAGSDQRRRSLQLGFFARTQGCRQAARESGQPDSQDQNSAHQLDQRKSRSRAAAAL